MAPINGANPTASFRRFFDSQQTRPLGPWFPQLLDPLSPQKRFGGIEPFFNLKQAASHVVGTENLLLPRPCRNARRCRVGGVSSKEKDPEPHGATHETSAKRPKKYLQHRTSTQEGTAGCLPDRAAS
jgi:hypothetical protein